MLTFKVDNQALPLPRQDEPFEMTYVVLGDQRRSASGRLRMQIVSSYWSVHVYWEGLNTTERNLLFQIYNSYRQYPGYWYLPNGMTFRGLCSSDWREQYYIEPYSLNFYYNVDFTIESF